MRTVLVLLLVIMSSSCVTPLKSQKREIPGVPGGKLEMTTVLAFWRHHADIHHDATLSLAVDALGEREGDDVPTTLTLGCVHARVHALTLKELTETGKIDGQSSQTPLDPNSAAQWFDALSNCAQRCSEAQASARPRDAGLLSSLRSACEDTSGVEAAEVAWVDKQLAFAADALEKKQLVLFRSCIGRAKNFRAKAPRSRELIDERVKALVSRNAAVLERSTALSSDAVFMAMLKTQGELMRAYSDEKRRSGENAWSTRQIAREMDVLREDILAYEEKAMRGEKQTSSVP